MKKRWIGIVLAAVLALVMLIPMLPAAKAASKMTVSADLVRVLKAMEGFSVNVDMSLKNLDKEQIRSFIVPGGNIAEINNTEVKNYLQELKNKEVLIAAICAGVDVLDYAGILQDVKSTHSIDEDFVSDKNIITARATAYVDFAIEVAKKLELFMSEEDLQETVDFWKNYKRVQ